jgi:AcrR family transcriptional regulator
MANESETSWKDKRKEQLREELIATASRLFRQNGFSAVSVEDIVAATGVAKGTFYLYFKTKADVVQASLSQALDDLDKQVSSATSQASSDAAASLRAVVNVILNFLQANPGMIGPITDNELASELGDDVLSRCRAATTSVFERLLRMGMLQGRYREIDPQIASHALHGMLAGLVHLSTETTSKFADVGEMAVELFERGIKRGGLNVP